MVFYVRRDADAVEDPGSRDDLPDLAQDLLARHGARMLRPTDPVLTAAGPDVRSTVYRYGARLLPGGVLREHRPS